MASGGITTNPLCGPSAAGPRSGQRYQQQADANPTQCVESLTMTFMPMNDDGDVIGRVSAAMTAGRSAAMVFLVSVRAW